MIQLSPHSIPSVGGKVGRGDPIGHHGRVPNVNGIEVKKNYGQRKEWSYNENKKCSEICEQNGTTRNHVEVEEVKFFQ